MYLPSIYLYYLYIYLPSIYLFTTVNSIQWAPHEWGLVLACASFPFYIQQVNKLIVWVCRVCSSPFDRRWYTRQEGAHTVRQIKYGINDPFSCYCS